MNNTHFYSEELRTTISIDQLKELIAKHLPDYVLLPRNPTRIMTLRGLQSDKVFKDDEFDLVCDYMSIDTREMPHVNGVSEGDSQVSQDEREFFVIASIYRGCVNGYEEWNHLKASDPSYPIIPYWDVPVVTPSATDLTYDQSLKKFAFKPVQISEKTDRLVVPSMEMNEKITREIVESLVRKTWELNLSSKLGSPATESTRNFLLHSLYSVLNNLCIVKEFKAEVRYESDFLTYRATLYWTDHYNNEHIIEL